MVGRDRVQDEVEAPLAAATWASSVVTISPAAPSRRASFSLAALRLRTVTSAPSAAANFTARWPSPPSPATATRCPGPVPAARSGSQTLMPAHSSGVAAAGSSASGRRNANVSRSTYSRL